MKINILILFYFPLLSQIEATQYPNSVSVYNTFSQKGVEISKTEQGTQPEFFLPKVGSSIGLRLNYSYLSLQFSKNTQNILFREDTNQGVYNSCSH